MTTTSRRSLSDVNRDLDACRRSLDSSGGEMIRLLESAPDGTEMSGGTLTRYNDLTRHVEKERNRLRDLEFERDTLVAERAEALGAVRTAAGLGRIEGGDGAAGTRTAPIPGMHRRNGNPWLERNAPSYGLDGTNLRSAALDAVERNEHMTDDAKQAATEVVERAGKTHEDPSNMAARWAVAMSDPAYTRGFVKAIRNPHQFGLLLDDDERHAMRRMMEYDALDRAAMAEGTTTTGGFMVPAHLDPTINFTNYRAPGPMRQIARVEQIATQTWKGINSPGASAEWTAEAAEAADGSPVIAQPTVTPVRWDVWIQASFEMLDDTSIGNEIGMLIAEAREGLHQTAFVTGTGSTQPWGVVTRVAATTNSRVAGSSGAAGAATLVLGDVYALDDALPARFQQNASWLGRKPVFNQIRRIGEGTTGTAANIWTDLGRGIPSHLIGYPVYPVDEMDSTVVSGSNDDVLILGDFRKYLIVDHVATRVVFEPLVKGANRRPTGEAGWFAMGRTGADCLNADAFRLLRL